MRSLRVQNVKLLRDVTIDFTDASGKPRMWTMFVGENRLCKTTLLQTIAAAAAGGDRATQLVTNVITSWPDLRRPQAAPLNIDVEFELLGPGVLGEWLWSTLALDPDKRVFVTDSGNFAGNESRTSTIPNQLARARAREIPSWFVAGYGPSRLLPSIGQAARQSEPALDRLRPLFGGPGRTWDQALTDDQPPPGAERPRILDPSDPSFDPTSHIEFRRETIQRIERWRPYGLTEAGQATIDACGLDRPGLLDLYREHVNHIVRPKLAPVVAALAQHDAAQVVRTWRTACRGLLAVERPFRALSHDALKVLVSHDVRDRYRLELPRP